MKHPLEPVPSIFSSKLMPLCAIICASTLAACGGGGGGTPSYSEFVSSGSPAIKKEAEVQLIRSNGTRQNIEVVHGKTGGQIYTTDGTVVDATGINQLNINGVRYKHKENYFTGNFKGRIFAADNGKEVLLLTDDMTSHSADDDTLRSGALLYAKKGDSFVPQDFIGPAITRADLPVSGIGQYSGTGQLSTYNAAGEGTGIGVAGTFASVKMTADFARNNVDTTATISKSELLGIGEIRAIDASIASDGTVSGGRVEADLTYAHDFLGGPRLKDVAGGDTKGVFMEDGHLGHINVHDSKGNKASVGYILNKKR